jgi:unsaturated rhamnogalacturonyl hydrolase
MKIRYLFVMLAITFSLPAMSQNNQPRVTDSNTALHAMQPDYKTPYGPMKTADITTVLDRIFKYLDESTPAKVFDNSTKKEIKNMSDLTPSASFEPGVFRLISYEWGVTYGAMLQAGEATGDSKFTEYSKNRISLIGDVAKYFKSIQTDQPDNLPVRSVLSPRALDDAGSMCTAMIKTYSYSKDEDLRPFINNYIDYISTKQLRLSDGTLARNRPQSNTLWLDDLYMSVPALAQMGKLTGDKKYYDDAVKQVFQFTERMYNEDIQLYCHGWVQEMGIHPQFYWGRANGWAMLAMTELLDVLPENHPGRAKLNNLLCSHINGVSRLQSGEGFWHQLLDRNDTYPETSATAIYTYCIAHAINKGWIDAQAYGPVAVLGWNAVKTKVNTLGQVEGTCVGTGMAFDPAFYYYRPVNVAAAHGYGPVIMAGAEMIKLSKNFQIVINDSAVMFYPLGADVNNNR